ncbi:MAG TPA: SDR family oxidoreductase [Holophagaceae bacterium]|nr:SDR family oxidoreductase [Holophagaceae bacterium]
MDFRGRSVLITGASEGIGRALALALAARGARLTLVAREGARLASLAEAVRAKGGEALVHAADVTAPGSAEAMVAAAVEAYGGLDAAVLNAGASMWTSFESLADPERAARDLMELNYFACLRQARAALPHLKASKGLLVPVASVAGYAGIPMRTVYAASKHAVVGFFESLRVELRGSGVDITIVAPDFVVTELHARALGPDGRPLGSGRLDPRRVMTAEACAELMVRAMARRRRLLLTSARSRLGRWLQLLAPGLVDRIAARAVARRA